MKYGFVRESTRTNDFEQMQVEKLKQQGAEEIIIAQTDVDYFSLTSKLKSGDCLYITDLTRLNRDYERAVLTAMYLREKKVDVYIGGSIVTDIDMMIAKSFVYSNYEMKKAMKKSLDSIKKDRQSRKGEKNDI